jgi:tetratricopeptide (TPR) repeat protein
MLERELTENRDLASAITDPRRPVATLGPEPPAEPTVRASTPMAYAMSDAPASAPTEPGAPSFTTASGLSVGPTLMDDWEPIRPPRSKGPWVATFLVLAAVGGVAAAYFKVWLPAQEEQHRLDVEQARVAGERQENDRRQAELREREQKAKNELVADLARAVAGASEDAGVQGTATPPRGALDAAPAPASGAQAVAAAPQSGAAHPRVVHAAEIRPKTYAEWMERGEVERANQRFAGALEDYDQAVALQPEQPEAHLSRGRTLLELGNRDSAVSAFQRALELNPRYSVAQFWLGEAQRRAGHRAEAIQAYERYLDLAPDGNQAEAARQALKTLKQE